jgi:hypothetical protein
MFNEDTNTGNHRILRFVCRIQAGEGTECAGVMLELLIGEDRGPLQLGVLDFSGVLCSQLYHCFG